MDFIEENEAEDFADSGDTSQTIPAVGIVHFGLFDDVEFEVIEEMVQEYLEVCKRLGESVSTG